MEECLAISPDSALKCNVPNLSELSINRFFEQEGQGYGWCGGKPPGSAVSQALRQALAQAASDDLKRAAAAVLEAHNVHPLADVEKQPVQVVYGADLCLTWKGANPKLLSEPVMPNVKDWCPEQFLVAFAKPGAISSQLNSDQLDMGPSDQLDLEEQLEEREAEVFDTELAAAKALLQLGGGGSDVDGE